MVGYGDAGWRTCHRKLQAWFKNEVAGVTRVCWGSLTNMSTAAHTQRVCQHFLLLTFVFPALYCVLGYMCPTLFNCKSFFYLLFILSASFLFLLLRQWMVLNGCLLECHVEIVYIFLMFVNIYKGNGETQKWIKVESFIVFCRQAYAIASMAFRQMLYMLPMQASFTNHYFLVCMCLLKHMHACISRCTTNSKLNLQQKLDLGF